MFTSKTNLISFLRIGSLLFLVGQCFGQIQLVQPTSVVSRLTHGSAGQFDINLPLSGPPGIECRSGGSSGAYQIVLTFPHAVTVTSYAVSGAASVATTSTSNNTVTVNLTGVADAQTITITLFGVTDGVNRSDVSVPMAVLVGDTTGNGLVNSSDISQTQSQSGQPVTATNFREDVTVDGFINSSDISLVQMKSGTTVPITSFSFTLDGSYKTSAAVYNTNGSLVRTLWRNVPYGVGPNTGYWDGNDDNGAPATGSSYLIKLLYHNVQYVWDGVIGNTSAATSGTTVHRGSTFMQSLAMDGTNAFYAIGECEMDDPVAQFMTTSLQSRTTFVQPDFLTGFDNIATDGTRVYIANRGSSATFNEQAPNNAFTTFVMARNAANASPSPFPSPYGTSVTINNNGPSHYDGVIDLNLYNPSPTPTPDAGVNPNRPTGLAVQKNGNVLAVAHGGLGLIRLFDKVSGAPITLGGNPVTISISSPQGLATAPNGDLWVISGRSVVRYSAASLTTAPIPVQTITPFNAPIAVAVCPSTTIDLVLVADGGTDQTAQVVKAFNTTSTNANTPLWTYGQGGGYSATNGPDVTDNKFEFQVGPKSNPIYRTALAVASDGSFWIGDGATERLLHINSNHTASLPADTIMFLSQNGATTADPNHPTRVIGDNWLEFQVDYTKPIQQGWTLTKNWAAGLATKYFGSGEGLLSVTTLNVNHVPRVYATMVDFSLGKRVIVELPSAGPLRVCKTATNNDLTIDPVQAAIGVGYDNTSRTPSFEADGSLRYNQFSSGPLLSWYQRSIAFDSLGNPTWGNATRIAFTPFDNKDPATITESGFPGQNQTVPITSSNVIVSFDAGHNKFPIPPCGPGCVTPANGWHLGGIAENGSQWQWKSSHAVSEDVPFDGLGSFDIGDGVQYPATVAMALGQNIIYDYNGELWDDSEGSQWMHFYDDGLFIGQFGTPGNFEREFNGILAGFSGGGSHFPTLVGVDGNNNASATGEAFIWANDESEHSGIIRWHIVGANTIREQTGTVTLGSRSNPPLGGPAATFPTNLTATPGDQQVTLSWSSFQGATSYDVKQATVSGGPYSRVTTTANTSYPVLSLANGHTYYFVVSATGSAVNSTEVEAWPFKTVGNAGSFKGGPFFNHYVPLYPFYVDSSAPASGKAALAGLSNVLGTLTRTNIGTKGYVIYDGTSVYNTVQSPFTVTQGSGWVNVTQAIQNQFVISGNASADGGLKATSSGTITVTTGGDSGVHYLSVFCPALSADPRTFALTLTPTGLSTPIATYPVNEPLGSSDNLIFQFEFTGNVTLTLTPTGGSGCLQAIFID
jgi:hypothetical protein